LEDLENLDKKFFNAVAPHRSPRRHRQKRHFYRAEIASI